ncbi:MAG TPA: aspartyl protease family protein [Opitutaceae bacterium]|nr:aspartyl protease family protein [Opitutaceae bacterium]
MKLLRTLLALVGVAQLFVSGCSSHPSLRPGRTTVSGPSVTVPAEVLGNHFVVEGKWDKHGPWHFLIDTGSSVTLVSPEFAKRYATDRAAFDVPPVRVKSSNGDSSLLPAVTVRRISLKGARFDNVQALIRDLSDLSNHLGVKIDAILGFPLFRETVFTMDYPNSKLVITSPQWRLDMRGSKVKFNNSQRTPLIPIHLGDVTMIALIDSGSDGPLSLNPFGLDLHYAVPPRPGSAVGTLSGNREQEIARLADPLEIGSYRFEEPIADLTDQLSSIGGEVLRNFAVTFDQPRNLVIFSRDDSAPIRTPSRRSVGMAFLKGPTYWRVVDVVPGSPAAAAGIKEGDLVTRINGETIANWPLQRFEPFVKRNAEVVFTFLDGSKEKPVVIPVFDLVP